jgi:hypothetical protein
MIKQAGDNVYMAESKSKPDEPHFLTVENDTIKCDCLGYKYRQTCRHEQELKKQLGEVNNV